MRLADHLGELDAVGGEGEARLRIALAVGAGALDQVDELVGDGGRRQRAVDVERDGRARRAAWPRARRAARKACERVELPARHREARRHGVAAALGEVAGGHGRAHGRADVDAGDGAQRAGALAALSFPGDDAGRAAGSAR